MHFNFGFSTLEVDGSSVSNLAYNTTDIDGSNLDDIVDVSDLDKIERLSGNGTIIFSLMDLGVLIEDNAEIILDGTELLVGLQVCCLK